MPRNPNATRPKAKTAGASINPNQNALKFPATKPERMLSEAPPSRDDVTTSRTCREPTDVKTFTNSGMIAPASVPQVITSDSFHHSVGSPPTSGITSFDTTNVSATETSDVSHTSVVSGVS